MIDKKKRYTLAMLSATSVLYAMGNVVIANANDNTGIVTASSLNVRSGPSTSNSILGGISRGQKVNIISSENGWYKIEFRNKTGWVSSKYISTDLSSSDNSNNSSSGETTDMSTTVKSVTATANLNVRNGGSTSNSVISYIRKGETVDVIGKASTGWYKVKLSNGVVGYASNKYLVESSGQSSDQGSSTTTDSNNSQNTTTIATLYSTANLNVRSGPSTSYSKIGFLSKGSTVSIVEYTNDNWVKVKLSNGKVGYCSRKYLSSSAQSNNNTSTSNPDTSTPNTSTTINGYEVAKTMQVKAYAYYTGSITATGTKPTAGRTIAVDPSVIPFGTKVYIPNFNKVFIAEDCGGAIKGNKVDIFMNSKSECINWGVRNITLHILK